MTVSVPQGRDDLAGRLRRPSLQLNKGGTLKALLDEAADEIDRLTAERDSLSVQVEVLQRRADAWAACYAPNKEETE